MKSVPPRASSIFLRTIFWASPTTLPIKSGADVMTIFDEERKPNLKKIWPNCVDRQVLPVPEFPVII